MRIGVVTQAYYPVLGGVTEHVWNLGTELLRRGHDVTVVTGAARDADDRGLRVLRLGVQIPVVSNGANVHLTCGWDLGGALREIERRERFDVVNIHSPLDPVLPLVASRAMRTPKVGTHHSARDTRSAADVVPALFRRALSEAAAAIERHVAVSSNAAAFVLRYLPEVRFDVVPNGIDTRRFSPDVSPLAEYDDDVFTILFVGRLDPRKGARYLFHALPYLEAALDRYRVVVVGSGWMHPYYRSHIPRGLRHRVTFAGNATPEDVPRFYRTADVYCSPATGNESFGIVLLEAMASGTPVVASDIGGYRSVVDSGNDGLLVPPCNPQEIAGALIRLAGDADLRRRMGVAGRMKAENYTWTRQVDRLIPIFEAAAGTRLPVQQGGDS
jgi:phosphatidylinositol alpha-mannosyltransferase